VNDGTVPLAVTPATIAIKDATQGCPGASSGVDVMIVGGDGPFTIHNPLPQSIALSTLRVDRSGQSFRVAGLGGCLDAIPLTVTDADANRVDFVISRTFVSTE
jgi:hypothetical protein